MGPYEWVVTRNGPIVPIDKDFSFTGPCEILFASSLSAMGQSKVIGSDSTGSFRNPLIAHYGWGLHD